MSKMKKSLSLDKMSNLLNKIKFPESVKLATLICLVLSVLADRSMLSICGMLIVLYAINKEMDSFRSDFNSIKNSHNTMRMRREPSKGK